MSLKNILKLTVKKVLDPFYVGRAAEVAFFLILSFVPTMFLLAQIFDLFTMSMTAIEDALGKYANNDLVDILLPLLQHTPSHAVNIFLFILSLWAGSRALFSLMRMANYAYKGGSGYKNPVFGYIRERLRALVTILLILLTLVFALNVLVYGEVILRAIIRYINNVLEQDFTFSSLWYTMRWIIAFGLYLFMVISIYYLLPNRESMFSRLIAPTFWKTVKNIFINWVKRGRAVLRLIFPGSLFAAIGMVIVTGLYSFYIRWIAGKENFNILYGGLSSVVVLLLWFYLLAFILIIGIQLNAAWAEIKKEHPSTRRTKRKRTRERLPH
ncbi:MAG: YihY/virulence factor BrkB family protein [Clostridiales Family XIII bacterium]|jgi:membrane protein|nr:YihY/virulence factor BrkB family protein [Clostridiales Family XIII bacterium]